MGGQNLAPPSIQVPAFWLSGVDKGRSELIEIANLVGMDHRI
jgi:hypothetical protein